VKGDKNYKEENKVRKAGKKVKEKEI
jgi:hypothetical protein